MINRAILLKLFQGFSKNNKLMLSGCIRISNIINLRYLNIFWKLFLCGGTKGKRRSHEKKNPFEKGSKNFLMFPCKFASSPHFCFHFIQDWKMIIFGGTGTVENRNMDEILLEIEYFLFLFSFCSLEPCLNAIFPRIPLSLIKYKLKRSWESWTIPYSRICNVKICKYHIDV